ncbi:MAG: class I SAM-dependent RNA methyltransferase [Candidatus Planktophila sp.]
MTSTPRAVLRVGQIIRVTIEKVAHGGHFIARHEGAVIFLRHGLPGEVVDVAITSIGSSFNRGDVVKVITASADRVEAPCTYANRNGCGGCDFQHVEISAQRKLKSQVITEQFSRIAKMEISVEVEEVSSPLGWRTQTTIGSDKNGHAGFYGSRTNTIIPIKNCQVLHSSVGYEAIAARSWEPGIRIEVSAASTKVPRLIAGDTVEGDLIQIYSVAQKEYQVSAGSFWQSNIRAPQVLVDAVRSFADVKSGDHLIDLYGGVGLFGLALLDLIGADGRIDHVEGSKSAIADAHVNYGEAKNVYFHTGDVEKILPRFSSADVVILDPPREGAKKAVIESLVACSPRAIVYVACDPAALARDTALLRDANYTLIQLRAFDLFPMTHHIECVALFAPTDVS